MTGVNVTKDVLWVSNLVYNYFYIDLYVISNIERGGWDLFPVVVFRQNFFEVGVLVVLLWHLKTGKITPVLKYEMKLGYMSAIIEVTLPFLLNNNRYGME